MCFIITHLSLLKFIQKGLICANDGMLLRYTNTAMFIYCKTGTITLSPPKDKHGRDSGLMVSVLLVPRPGHCIVFLGKTLNSHGASLHPGV